MCWFPLKQAFISDSLSLINIMGHILEWHHFLCDVGGDSCLFKMMADREESQESQLQLLRPVYKGRTDLKRAFALVYFQDWNISLASS